MRQPPSFAMKQAIAGALKKNTPIPQRLGSASTRTIGSGGPTISTDGASTRAAVIGAPTAFGSSSSSSRLDSRGVGFGRRLFFL